MTTTKFTDAAGREWDLALNIGAVRRVEKECGAKLAGNFDGVLKLACDPILLCAALAVILGPQLEERGITADQFFNAIGGPELEAAVNAFFESMIQFLPTGRQETARMAADRMRQAEKAAYARATEAIDKLDVDSIIGNQFAPPATAV